MGDVLDISKVEVDELLRSKRINSILVNPLFMLGIGPNSRLKRLCTCDGMLGNGPGKGLSCQWKATFSHICIRPSK